MALCTSIPTCSSVTSRCSSIRIKTRARRRNCGTPHRRTVMSNLSGKTALVTGASRGIGRASALKLAQAGACVLVHYGRGAKEADGVVAEIKKSGGRAEAIAADLSAPDGAHQLADQTRRIVGERL